MTAGVRLTLEPHAPLTQHLRRAEALLDAGAAAVRTARLLAIGHIVCGPFPQATELIVTVAADDGRVDVEAIKDPEGYRWTNDGGLSTCPQDYSTDDGYGLDAVIDHVAAELETLLGDDDPRQVWEETAANTYRVQLPEAAEVQRAASAPPAAPDSGYDDITSLTDALATLRDWLEAARPTRPSFRRRDRAGIPDAVTALLDQLATELDELEDSAIAEQQCLHALREDGGRPLRLEVVVDRDPDNDTNVAAFVNGIRHKPEVTVVDPGATTWSLTQWRATGRHHARLASPAAAALIRDWFAAAEDSEFVAP